MTNGEGEGPALKTVNSTHLLSTELAAYPGKLTEFRNCAPSAFVIVDTGDRCIRGTLSPHRNVASSGDYPRSGSTKPGRLPGGGGTTWAGAPSGAGTASLLSDFSKSAPALELGFSTWNHRTWTLVPIRPCIGHGARLAALITELSSSVKAD